MTVRHCTDRDCGNNSRRKINPRDYDSVMGFLCDRCTDAENEPVCPVCEVRKEDHDDVYPCRIDRQD